MSEEKKPSFLAAEAINEENRHKLMIPDEPLVFEDKDINRILKFAVQKGVSDITVQLEKPIMFQIYGRIEKVTKRNMSLQEIEGFIKKIFGESAISILNSGQPMNNSYTFKDEYNDRLYYRFRVNVSKGRLRDNASYQITARVIPSQIPYLSDMKLPEDLEYNLMNFSKGIALVTGATGSGKSTLLASIIAEFLRNEKYHKKILTSEEPIEFTYDEIDSKHSVVHQSAVPSDISSFALATATALRRAPNIILIGEARDGETIREASVAAMTGHEVYTTVHSNGFADTFRRMVDVFPDGEKPGVASNLISNTKIVLSQRLVPSTDGKRVALREYVILNDEIREFLLLGGVDKLTYTCKQVLDKYGHSFQKDAKEKLDLGLISQETYNSIIMNTKAIDQGIEEEGLRENMEVEILKTIQGLQEELTEQAKINNILLSKIIKQDEQLKSINFIKKAFSNSEEKELNF